MVLGKAWDKAVLVELSPKCRETAYCRFTAVDTTEGIVVVKQMLLLNSLFVFYLATFGR